MSTDVSLEDTVRHMEEMNLADREYASPQSQPMELVGKSLYGDYITHSHEKCSKSVVLVLFSHKNDPAKEVTAYQTGIIIASGMHSCYIITSRLFQVKDQVCDVQFCDGTKWACNYLSVQKEVGMSILLLNNVNMANAKSAILCDNPISSCEKVFTCGFSFPREPNSGYSSSLNGRSFFSGSIASGVGMKDKTMEKASLVVHGCATGPRGHLGSAVFNEKQSLVGMNILYTMSKGFNYDDDMGGTVSALDLASIGLGFVSVWKTLEGKTLHEMVIRLSDALILKENNQKGG